MSDFNIFITRQNSQYLIFTHTLNGPSAFKFLLISQIWGKETTQNGITHRGKARSFVPANPFVNRTMKSM